LLRIPQLPVKEELDEVPSIEEVVKAIEQLKTGKAAGIDGIPPEIWKLGGPSLHDKLLEFFAAGIREFYRKTFEMQSSSPCTRTKAKNQTAPTIGVLPYYPLPVKSLQECC
jgi:hypothetical protein